MSDDMRYAESISRWVFWCRLEEQQKQNARAQTHTRIILITRHFRKWNKKRERESGGEKNKLWALWMERGPAAPFHILLFETHTHGMPHTEPLFCFKRRAWKLKRIKARRTGRNTFLARENLFHNEIRRGETRPRVKNYMLCRRPPRALEFRPLISPLAFLN